MNFLLINLILNNHILYSWFKNCVSMLEKVLRGMFMGIYFSHCGEYKKKKQQGALGVEKIQK